jgi:transposase
MPRVGPITSLTWAREIGDHTRFRSIREVITLLGLCGDENSSADKLMRMPLSSQLTSESSVFWWKPPSLRPEKVTSWQ